VEGIGLLHGHLLSWVAIPPDLYEAAAIDGSDGIRKHWDITVPLMKPYLVLVAVFLPFLPQRSLKKSTL